MSVFAAPRLILADFEFSSSLPSCIRKAQVTHEIIVSALGKKENMSAAAPKSKPETKKLAEVKKEEPAPEEAKVEEKVEVKPPPPPPPVHLDPDTAFDDEAEV